MKQFLGVALKAGNSLNAGTIRGNANGFKPSSYCKLSEIKANQGNLSLLGYLVRQMLSDSPAILDFTQKFESVKEAGKYSLEQIKTEVGQLRRQVTQLESTLTQAKAANDEPFVEEVEPWLEETIELIDSVVDKVEQAQ